MTPPIRMATSILWTHVSLDAHSCISRHVYQRCHICICICLCLICRSHDVVVLVLALVCKASHSSLPVMPSCFRGHILHSILSHLLFTSCCISRSAKMLITMKYIHHDIQSKTSLKNQRKTSLIQLCRRLSKTIIFRAIAHCSTGCPC